MNMPVIQESTLDVVKQEREMALEFSKNYPRDLEQCVKECKFTIESNPELAEKCTYTITKGGQPITGPSIRLAEVIDSIWGNLRFGARFVGEDDRMIHVLAYIHDLEKNNFYEVQVSLSVVGNKGRYSRDLIQTTIQAAKAKAIRNCIFKAVPYHFVEQLRQHAFNVSLPKDKHTQKVKEFVDWFKINGVSEDQILKKLDLDNIMQISEEQLKIIMGIATGLQEGTTSVRNEFHSQITRPGRKK